MRLDHLLSKEDLFKRFCCLALKVLWDFHCTLKTAQQIKRVTCKYSSRVFSFTLRILIMSIGQVTKSARRMPWRQEPMKDGASTEMPRGVASRHRSVDVRMGKPTTFNRVVSLSESNRVRKVTEGTETSKYLEEKKST